MKAGLIQITKKSSKRNPQAVCSRETLWHFSCEQCRRWWSIGDAPRNKSEWYCPWCGLRQIVTKVI